MLLIRALLYAYFVVLLIIEGRFFIGASVAPETFLFSLITYSVVSLISLRYIDFSRFIKDHKCIIKLLILFFAINFLSAIKNGGMGYYLFHFLLWPANFAVVLLLITDNKKLTAMMILLTIVAVVRCCLYLCHVNPWIVLHEVSSTESYRNPFAYSLMLPFIFVAIKFIHSKLRIVSLLWFVLLSVFLLTLLSTLSRGGYFSIILTLCGVSVFYLVQSKGKKYRAFAPLTVMAIFFIGILSVPEYLIRFKSMYRIDIPSSLMYRYNIYRTSLFMAISNPFWGVGPGRFAYAVRDYAMNPDVLSPEVALRLKSLTDSDFAQILAETGFLSLSIFIFMLAVVCSKYVTLIKNIHNHTMRMQTLIMTLSFGFAMYIINMAFDNTMTSSLGWFLLGFFYVGSRQDIYLKSTVDFLDNNTQDT